jgi:hypothetical protein
MRCQYKFTFVVPYLFGSQYTNFGNAVLTFNYGVRRNFLLYETVTKIQTVPECTECTAVQIVVFLIKYFFEIHLVTLDITDVNAILFWISVLFLFKCNVIFYSILYVYDCKFHYRI